jgi:hypothetical protein
MAKWSEQGFKSAVNSNLPLMHSFRALQVRKKMDADAFSSDRLISDAINLGQPALIGRLGGTEARVIGCYLDIFKGRSILDPLATLISFLSYRKRIIQLRIGAGFYPATLNNANNFAELYLELLTSTDLLGTWGAAFTWPESLLIQSRAKFIPLVTTSPWIRNYPSLDEKNIPWSKALNGKKVLVISAFSKTFESQFSQIHKVFPETQCHNFEAIFLDAPLTQGGMKDNLSWNYHLEETQAKMKSIDFDIALISAGAYSYPLARFAKTLGRVGIHSGGELQLFFGVIGKRWERYYKYLDTKNEYWVRPRPEERPINWKMIENGCYW